MSGGCLAGDRLTSPAAARNRGPILDVLRRVLPATGRVLEVASGTGEHAAFFGGSLPGLLWQPTDADPANLRSIAAWAALAASNVLPPLLLDAARPASWPVSQADAILAVNLIHIAPWAAAQGLFTGAARVLPPRGRLVLYGPFREPGLPVAESNMAFDADLKARDPRWGLRDLARVTELAGDHGFHLRERVEMPANNLVIVFETTPENRAAVNRARPGRAPFRLQNK